MANLYINDVPLSEKFLSIEGIDLMYIEKNGKMSVQTYYPFDVWVEYY